MAGTQVQTNGPGVQVVGMVVTTPSGPAEPPPEQAEYSAWQVNGTGQSAAVLHARSLATQVPLVCGTGGPHDTSAGQVGPLGGTATIRQSKSALGQSATLAQTMGLGSQIPVTAGVGTGMGGSGFGCGATPASAEGTGALVGGLVTDPQFTPAGQTIPVAPPAPSLPVPETAPDPTLVAPPTGGLASATTCATAHWYPVPQSESVMQSLAAAG
jgi:hypothetical protein